MGILGEDFCFKTKFNRLRQLKTSSRVWELVVLLHHEYIHQLDHGNNINQYKSIVNAYRLRRDFHLRLLGFYLEQVWQQAFFLENERLHISCGSRVEFYSMGFCGNNGFLAKRIAL